MVQTFLKDLFFSCLSPEQRWQSSSHTDTDMRIYRFFLSISLLGLLLWASCTQAEESEDRTETQEDASQDTTEREADEAKEEPKKEKTTEIEEEQDVMILHINNFDRALSKNKFLLVEFCKY